ncbi:hypothetical protein thalar_01679 [Litoreibacter arenae DSM 19593]|uniref:Uncharacterized protein n=1 Tax=Litoreibacter arenae DSM 19593 TaxID=1123360 RepID=S9S298_9RHOB|nr:hypothetical protein thalar_01679 [Litoreibacter arenae DSM 19593]
MISWMRETVETGTMTDNRRTGDLPDGIRQTVIAHCCDDRKR